MIKKYFWHIVIDIVAILTTLMICRYIYLFHQYSVSHGRMTTITITEPVVVPPVGSGTSYNVLHGVLK